MLRTRYKEQTEQVKKMLAEARNITVCIDGWSKKNLTSSFLGISGCFFDVKTNHPVHVFLDLALIDRPHTGERLSLCVKQCLQKWGISSDNVLLVITDNGANMVKAIRLLKAEVNQLQNSEDAPDSEESEDERDEDELETSIVDDIVTVNNTPYRWMACIVHSLQLVVKLAYGHYDKVLSRTRQLVCSLRKSSVALEKLIERCGKTVINDCVTRWSSTFQMTERLLAIKPVLNLVLTEIGNFCLFMYFYL